MPKADSDGELETLTGDFFTTDTNSDDYLEILADTEVLLTIAHVVAKKLADVFITLQELKMVAFVV